MVQKKLTRISVEPISKIAKQRFNGIMCKLHICLIENESDEEFYLSSANKHYRFIMKKQNDPHWNILK